MAEAFDRHAHRCVQCGSLFGGRKRKYCGDECAHKGWLTNRRKRLSPKLSERPCVQCGGLYQPSNAQNVAYCSRGCKRRAYEERHPDRWKVQQRAARSIRRARLAGATVEQVDPIAVFERDGWRCHLCLKLTLRSKRGSFHERAPELDHIVPLSKGGEHSYANTACSCRFCNRRKGASIIGQGSLLSFI